MAPVEHKISIPPLSDTARSTLVKIARILSTGFTGQITIQVIQGGVRRVDWTNHALGEEIVREVSSLARSTE